MSTPEALLRSEHARALAAPNGRRTSIVRTLAGWRARLGRTFGLAAWSGPGGGSTTGLDAEADLEEVARQEEARLAHRLFLRPDAPRTVLFAGAEREEGCAEICLGVARSIAGQSPGRVCVVDANLRAPAAHRSVGLKNHGGLSVAILEAVPASTLAQRLSSPDNLWLLPSGFAVPDPNELLTPDRLQPHMRELGQRFERILVTAPPVNAFGDALALGQVVDGAVLVVAANSTRRQAVRRAIGRLQAFDVPLLGIVLSGRTFPIPEPLYRLL